MSRRAWERRVQRLEETALGGGLRLFEARRPGARRRGLAGLDPLPPDVGLRLHRCSSVHTIGMRFALDLVWLGRDGAVLRVDLDVPPRRLRACRGARQVVETTAGSGAAFAAALASRVLISSSSAPSS